MINILNRSKKHGTPDGASGLAKIVEMDLRLQALEKRIMDHADELRDRICDSLDRIEERLEDEILPSTVNPLDRLGGSPAVSAGDALSEFSNTINLTRDHLDALTQSISSMRGQLSKA